jgi:hypothetical protein
VVDMAGNLHGHFLDDTIPRSNSAWLDERRLLLTSGRDDWNHRIVDVATGEQPTINHDPRQRTSLWTRHRTADVGVEPVAPPTRVSGESRGARIW